MNVTNPLYKLGLMLILLGLLVLPLVHGTS
jgi:hypothetical protein